jgi:hypothetical protein
VRRRGGEGLGVELLGDARIIFQHPRRDLRLGLCHHRADMPLLDPICPLTDRKDSRLCASRHHFCAREAVAQSDQVRHMEVLSQRHLPQTVLDDLLPGEGVGGRDVDLLDQEGLMREQRRERQHLSIDSAGSE